MAGRPPRGPYQREPSGSVQRTIDTQTKYGLGPGYKCWPRLDEVEAAGRAACQRDERQRDVRETRRQRTNPDQAGEDLGGGQRGPEVDGAGQAGGLGDLGVGAVGQPPVQQLGGAVAVRGLVDQPQLLGCDPGPGELLVGGVAGVEAGEQPGPVGFQNSAVWLTCGFSLPVRTR